VKHWHGLALEKIGRGETHNFGAHLFWWNWFSTQRSETWKVSQCGALIVIKLGSGAISCRQGKIQWQKDWKWEPNEISTGVSPKTCTSRKRYCFGMAPQQPNAQRQTRIETQGGKHWMDLLLRVVKTDESFKPRTKFPAQLDVVQAYTLEEQFDCSPGTLLKSLGNSLRWWSGRSDRLKNT